MNDRPTPCFGQSDLFDAIDPHSHKLAKALCDECPLIAQCRDNLLQAQRESLCVGYGPEGTWAGMLLKSRKAA